MATRSIVPNADNEGSLGLDPKRWASVHATELKQAGNDVLDTSDLATQVEAEAGENNGKWMTPLRVAQAIAALGGEGGGSSGDLIPYLLRSASFSAQAGKAYACDTTGTVTVPAVLKSFTAGGVVFTAKSYPGPSESITISAFNGGVLAVGEFHVYTEPDVTTCGDVVAAVNASPDPVFTAALASGTNANDIFPNLDDPFSFSGGSPETTAPATFNVTLPAAPAPGDVIALADAKGSWANNPVNVLRNGKKIEGVESNFVNNAAGTFFSLLYIDSTKGWRVLASGTKPLNLSAPTITGAFTLTCSTGTWTGSPASYAYQWQISDDGETDWSNISGATTNSYTPIEADETRFVRCGVIATNANGPSAVAYSDAEGPLELPDFPMAGLVAFWKLTDLTDSSGNGNALTNNNSVTFGAGKVGNAAEFDGSNYLSANGSSDWVLGGNAGNGATVNFWMRRSGTQAAELMGNRNAGIYCPWAICLDSDNTLRLLSNNGGAWAVTSGGAYGSTNIPDATWVMVTIVRDASNLVTVFINGVADPDMTDVPAPTDSTPNDLFIGSGGDGSFEGKMDGIGVWDRALTTPEIALLYNSGDGNEPA